MKDEKKPAFETDFDKELWLIEIIATPGGHKLTVKGIGDHPTPKYQEVIGSLEIMKQKIVWDQMEGNKKAATKFNKRKP